MQTAVRKHLALPLLIAASLGLGGCSSLGYYGQAISGQLEILNDRRPLETVIEDDDTPPAVRDKLRLVRSVLAFAHEELALPDNGSYRQYADLGRPFVTWNVFAAPELSLRPRRWCYLPVGCFNYRGYFDREAALQYGANLRRQGWDVYVGGVRAYSTLGWFRDPVLNTMLDQADWEIARLIFHELAHQKVYLANGTDLNEAFAESVARIGLERWLASRPPASTVRIRQALDFEDDFIALLLDYKQRLGQVYRSDRPAAAKRLRKRRLLDELRVAYTKLKARHGGDDRYDRWMSGRLNNGKLVAVSTYRRLMPAFLALYRSTGDDLTAFYAYVEDLRECGRDSLRQRLRDYRPGESC